MFRAICLFVFSLVFPLSAMAVDEPNFIVVLQDETFEIRKYEAMIVAEVEVTGDMRRAGNSGFRPLFRYITGNNSQSGKIDMTAPVTRTPTKIDMTAPVTRTPTENDGWMVAFVMPDDWSMETLPIPNDEAVKLRAIPEELMAVVRFSGSGRQSAHMEKETKLRAWLNEQGYLAVGEPRYAGYDAPYVPGFMRRNEVMIPVEKVE